MPWDFWVIFIVLGALLPWRGHTRLKVLLAQPATTGADRLALYVSTIGFQWLMVLVTAWRAWARGLTWAEMGLVNYRGSSTVLAGTLVGAAAFGGLQWLNLRSVGARKGKSPGVMRRLAERILPQSRKELSLYLLLALTAGVCEEFLYRGFTMAALTGWGMPAWSVVLLSSILFGLAHAYQGRSGVLGTLVIGTVFGVARIGYDSLLPVMAWHAAFDAVAGLVGPRYLLAPRSAGEETRGSAEK